MNVVIVNDTSATPDSAIEALLPALQTQVIRDFAPAWGATATLSFAGRGQTIADGCEPVYVRDRCGDPGDLGYHEDDTSPEAVVGALDCTDDGIALATVLSHEILEMLADPLASATAPGSDGLQYMKEVCDPVQGDNYEIDGVPVSNFVLPGYFGLLNPSGSNGPGFDYLGRLAAGCPALTAGGYIEGWNGSQWVQSRGRRADGSHSPLSQRNGRSAWRARRKRLMDMPA